MAITARRLVSRHPSQYPEAHGPSVPRWGPPTLNPSRATSVPASGPPGPQPSESQRARGGHPTPSAAGLRPALSQAPSTAPQRPPGYRSRPRPAPPPLGAAALANTKSARRSLTLQQSTPNISCANQSESEAEHSPPLPSTAQRSRAQLFKSSTAIQSTAQRSEAQHSDPKHSTAGKRMQGKVMADQAQRGPGG